MGYNNISPQILFKLCLGVAAFGIVLLISSIGLFVFQLTTTNPKKAEAGSLGATSYREFWCAGAVYGPNNSNGGKYERYGKDCLGDFINASDPYSSIDDKISNMNGDAHAAQRLADGLIGDYRTAGTAFVGSIATLVTKGASIGDIYPSASYNPDPTRRFLTQQINANANMVVTQWNVYGSIGGYGDDRSSTIDKTKTNDIQPDQFGGTY